MIHKLKFKTKINLTICVCMTLSCFIILVINIFIFSFSSIFSHILVPYHFNNYYLPYFYFHILHFHFLDFHFHLEVSLIWIIKKKKLWQFSAVQYSMKILVYLLFAWICDDIIFIYVHWKPSFLLNIRPNLQSLDF